MFEFIKSISQKIPWVLGILISKISYQYRPYTGRKYLHTINQINKFENLSIDAQKSYILKKIQKTLSSSLSIPFYTEIYDLNKCNIKDIKSLDAFSELPITNKQLLQNCPIDLRSNNSSDRYMANTGGSSGEPLSFFLSPKHTSSEWAHMHYIWNKLDYSQDKLKLIFSGRNIGNKNVIYDGLRHSYVLNIYKSFDQTIVSLEKIISNRKIEYLHGYPSAIYDFCCYLADNNLKTLLMLKNHLKGVLLGSEFPLPEYRKRIDEILGVESISWYGHSERSALAFEKNEKYTYHVFHTYGFCEAVKNDNNGYNLVVTSYTNNSSPFIRYDTGDEIEPVLVQDGLLKSFKIKKGREGDFILDRNGFKISLTAFVFGRHHKLFEIARFIQVQQKKNGKVIFLITPSKSFPVNFVIEDWMDLKDVNIKYEYKIISSPVLTNIGKFLLKVQ